jgi:nitrogen regulatory protein PII
LQGVIVKLIVAVIPDDKLRDVQETLKEPDVYIMYVSPVGDVRDSILGYYRGSEYRTPRPRLRLEVVVVNDLRVQDTVADISRLACTRHPASVSSGSIFVMPLDEWIHIPAERPQAVLGSFEKADSVREAS